MLLDKQFMSLGVEPAELSGIVENHECFESAWVCCLHDPSQSENRECK